MNNEYRTVTMKLKPHKISKYLRVMFQDISEDMQNKIAPASAAIYERLRIGDAKNATPEIDKYVTLLKAHLEEIAHLREVLERDVLSHLDIEEGQATQFIGVDGKHRYSVAKGDKVNFGKKKSSSDAEVLKDLPDLEEDSLGVDGGGE